MFNTHLSKISRFSNYTIDRSLYFRLDANERTIPFNKRDISELKKYITSDLLQSYPSQKESLIKLISKKEKVNKKYINLIPGADPGIKYIFDIFSAQKGNVLSIYPTYGMIEIYCKTHKYKLLKIKESNFNDFLSKNKINSKTLFVYLANPNSPSGKLLDKNIIMKILKKAKKNNILVIIDEAYIDFALEKSFSNLVKNYSNLIVLKTFSKCIGIAGLRLGYTIANPKINSAINAIRPPHDISIFSIKVAEYFLSKKKIWTDYLKMINLSKTFVNNECKKRNFKFLNTEANFFHIFFDKKKILKLVKYLKNSNFLVASKYLGSYKSYKNSLRITYGSVQQIKVFFKMVDKFLLKNKI